MRILKSWKATALRDEPRLPLRLDFSEPVPPMPESPSSRTGFVRCQEFYRAEAKPLVRALVEHLPGGLVDALLVELLAERAALFVVPHRDPTPEAVEAALAARPAEAEA